jgi:4-carboxymuconolactone decarboxylase
MNGRPINVHGLMAHNPELLKAWWSFRNYSVNGGALGKRKGALVILRVAVHTKAWYEWGSHVERSLACGLTMDEIDRVKVLSGSNGWEPSEAILLRAVDELIAAHGLSQDTHIALCEHYSIQQVMDIMAIHGMYVILACMVNTWGLELDSHVQDKLPDGLTKEAFEAEYA